MNFIGLDKLAIMSSSVAKGSILTEAVSKERTLGPIDYRPPFKLIPVLFENYYQAHLAQKNEGLV